MLIRSQNKQMLVNLEKISGIEVAGQGSEMCIVARDPKTASDGIDGIAVFLKEQIDLILLDILLPKMDGYAVCELIRKESEVPIIMISALGREEDQIKGFEMQIDDYIPKPISLPIMIKKIEAVLRRYEKWYFNYRILQCRK